jgi:nucleoside-diphosphate-sugar epimerase
MGVDVTGADNNRVKPEEEPRFPIVQCNVRRPKEIRGVLGSTKPRVIYWFPAQQGYRREYAMFSHVQCVGSYALFQILAEMSRRDYKPERIILASSQAVYEPWGGAKETTSTNPPSVYGLSKLQQERAFMWFCEKSGIPCIALRYSIVLGPGQSLQASESGLIRNWYRAWRKDKPGEIYGNGTQMRDFVHIDDVAQANIATLQLSASDVFNIGGQTRSILQMSTAWQNATGCKPHRVINKDVRPGGEYDMTSNSAKAAAILAWRPELPPEKQIQDFIDFATRNEDHTEDATSLPG